ncbi:helix-turn-helix domain-containing protein [Yinghuangia aomiensis]
MTDRQSPSADRVVRILTLLTDHPGERLTLTQIAERLEMSKPTCLGVLASLSSAGLLTRDDAKTCGPRPGLCCAWAPRRRAAWRRSTSSARTWRPCTGRPAALHAGRQHRRPSVRQRARPPAASSPPATPATSSANAFPPQHRWAWSTTSGTRTPTSTRGSPAPRWCPSLAAPSGSSPSPRTPGSAAHRRVRSGARTTSATPSSPSSSPRTFRRRSSAGCSATCRR